MYLIPAGLLIKASPAHGAHQYLEAAPNLTLDGFLLHNLLPVTIGNMTGGAIFVGAIYWILYLRKTNA